MKLIETIQKKIRDYRNQKLPIPRRYWDFSYANKFMKEYRNEIMMMSLEMFNDNKVKEVFISEGNLVQAIDASYQWGKGTVDGTWGSVHDYPCIHVIYKGGAEEYIACYKDVNFVESYMQGHRKLSRERDTLNVVIE